MQNFLKNARFKTTIASIAGALVVFSLEKWLIDWSTAKLLSSMIVYLGVLVNIISYTKK